VGVSEFELSGGVQMTINIPFDGLEQSMELVKFSSLYFDKVNLVCTMTKDSAIHKYYDEGVVDSLNSLKNRNFFTIEKIDAFTSSPRILAIVHLILKGFKHTMGLNLDEIDKDENALMNFIDQIKTIYNNNFNDFGKTTPFSAKVSNIIGIKHKHNAEIAGKFLALNLIHGAAWIYCILKNKNYISNNPIIEKIIEYHYGSDRTNKNDIIAMNALPIFLPNIHQMELDDILELRHHSKDELANMRYYIDNLSKEFSPDDLKHEKLKFHLEKKINPSIDELSRKVSGLKMNTFQKFISNFRDPKTYVPLATTFFTNIPAHIALALSAGLIAADTAAEYKKQLDEIKNDPLYFSLQLRKQNSSWY